MEEEVEVCVCGGGRFWLTLRKKWQRKVTYLHGEGEGEEVAATQARAAGRVKPRGTIRSRLWGSTERDDRSRRGPRRPGVGSPAALGSSGDPRGCRNPLGTPTAVATKPGWGARREPRVLARARRRLFGGEALPLQRPSATAVIRAFQPQMWA